MPSMKSDKFAHKYYIGAKVLRRLKNVAMDANVENFSTHDATACGKVSMHENCLENCLFYYIVSCVPRPTSFLNLFIPRKGNFRTRSFSSYVSPLRPFTNLVAALWILSR